jgi:hypothetical protein
MTESSGGQLFAFTLVAPATSGAALSAAVRLAGSSPSPFLQGAPVNLIVRGQPDNTSVLSCQGATSGTDLIRVNETIQCTIAVRSNNVAIAAFIADFAAPLVLGSAFDAASGLTETAGGVRMSFNIFGVPTSGTTVRVRGRLSPNTNFSQTEISLIVVGTPSANSSLTCVGQESLSSSLVKRLETVTCTLVVADANGPTTGIASDFSVPTVTGGTSVSPLLAAAAPFNDGSRFVFSFTTTATAVSSTVRVFLADGVTELNNRVTLAVRGRPTAASTLTCVGNVTGTTTVRINEVVRCAVAARDALGPTTAALSDFSIPSVSAGQVLTATLEGNNNASLFSFFTRAPADTSTTFSVSIALNSSGINIIGSPFQLDVRGQPTNASVLSCQGQSTGEKSVRAGQAVICFIFVRNQAASTTAFAVDFDLNVTQGTVSSPLAESSKGAFMTATVLASSAVGDSVVIRATLADGSPLLDTSEAIAILGIPTEASTLTCVGDSSNSSTVQILERVTCTIFVRNASSPTMGLSSDFLAPASVGGTQIDVIQPVDAGRRMQFKVTAPAVAGDEFSVTGRIRNGGGTSFSQGPFRLTVLGRPTRDSVILCAGARSGSLSVRTLETVVCHIWVQDSDGNTTGAPSDFASPQLSAGVLASALRSNGAGTFISFNVTAPSTVGAYFTIIGKLEDGTPFSQGALQLTVVGTPTVNSTVACAGVRSGTSSVRVGERALCTITVRDGSGLTTGVAGDFDSPAVVGGLNVQPSSGVSYVAGGATMRFFVDAPATVGAPFSVTGQLANATRFAQGGFSFIVGRSLPPA